MEKNQITGIITNVLEPKSGVSKSGKTWKTQEFVVEETGQQYPQKMCFEVFGDENLEKFNLKKNDEVTVYFNLSCNEYRGRFYNQLRAWSVQKRNASQNNSNKAVERETTNASTEKQAVKVAPEDDLPF